MMCVSASISLISYDRHRCCDENHDGFDLLTIRISIDSPDDVLIYFGGSLLRLESELWDFCYIGGIIRCIQMAVKQRREK